jgi:hypothetical protein
VPYSFLDSFERIAHPDYCPSTRDMLMCRVISTGVTEMRYLSKCFEIRSVQAKVHGSISSSRENSAQKSLKKF